VAEQAPFAPFVQNGEAYVPLDELLHGLDLAPKRDGGETVLQPQLASIDVRTSGAGAKVIAHAGVPLDARVVMDSDGKLVVAFDGVGSTLERSRRVDANGLRQIDISTQGTVSDPRTLVTLILAPGTKHGPPSTDDQRDFTIGFNGASAGLAQTQPQAAQTSASSSPNQATVTAVDGSNTSAGYQVHIAVSGNASYEWHRLRPPDNRWYVDIQNADLGMPAGDRSGGGPVSAIRTHQSADGAVRVALSLSDYDTVDVAPSATGLTITVSNAVADVSDAVKSGSGSIGSDAVANAPVEPQDNQWKFGRKPEPAAPPYAAQNKRLIVIDPGHGGSDPGTLHGGLAEKNLNLDMSKRLRTLLIARGWQVMMTRDTDKDVYGPYAEARPELQARVDVANNAGARMFVSIHVNGFMNAGPRGVTTYYSKPIDVPLAADVQHRLAADLGTADDGIVKGKLYVTLHSSMPAILVETAFLTNPGDYARLNSPEWRQKVAQAIADGIGDYAGSAPGNAQTSGQ
ncbi:MAG: N-acetylmuramoyl-L-alanine amidase, partial [Candidatus Eremiobacteraeota bacterium]|nr:N-acetylmuramoyl-L-alanine amidase [Candidatus Eremiobacteraeota bacterium]